MKKLLFKSLMMMGAMLTAVTGFTSCSGEDEKLDEIIENGTNSEDPNIYDIDKNNLVLGHWTYRSSYGYELFIFNADGTYTEEYRTENTHKKVEGTYSYNDETITLTANGKSYEYKINKLNEMEFNFYLVNGFHYDCKRTTLNSLEDGEHTSYEETSIKVTYYTDYCGYTYMSIRPDWGVKYIRYSIDEEFNEPTSKKVTNGYNSIDKTFKYDPGTEHTLTIIAYDQNGNAFKTSITKFTMAGDNITNYFFYMGKQYPLYSAEMLQKHDYTGTNTGTNFKYLNLYSDDNSRILFTYAVHEWEGIDKEWGEGTYKINKSYSSYYSYSCTVIINGKVKNASESYDSGMLVIKKQTSNYMTFDFLIGDEIRGHFEGNIQ